MWRYLFISLIFAAPATAQVIDREDHSILDQLVPESFKLSGTATVAFSGLRWRTTINYALTNDSGMNLFVGIERSGVSIGSCTDVESSGGLPLLPSPGQRIYAGPIGAGPPRGVTVLAGAQVTGTIVLFDCDAPNPGFETTSLALSLMLGKQSNYLTMQAVPLSATVPIRRMRPPF